MLSLSPVYVNPRKFSWRLDVNGVPIGFTFGRVDRIAILPAADDGFPVRSIGIPPPGPLYEWPVGVICGSTSVLAASDQSNGTSRKSEDVNIGSKFSTLSRD